MQTTGQLYVVGMGSSHRHEEAVEIRLKDLTIRALLELFRFCVPETLDIMYRVPPNRLPRQVIFCRAMVLSFLLRYAIPHRGCHVFMTG